MKFNESKSAFLAERKIELALFLMKKVYPNLYRDAGLPYMRAVLKIVLQNQPDDGATSLSDTQP